MTDDPPGKGTDVQHDRDRDDLIYEVVRDALNLIKTNLVLSVQLRGMISALAAKDFEQYAKYFEESEGTTNELFGLLDAINEREDGRTQR